MPLPAEPLLPLAEAPAAAQLSPAAPLSLDAAPLPAEAPLDAAPLLTVIPLQPLNGHATTLPINPEGNTPILDFTDWLISAMPFVFIFSASINNKGSSTQELAALCMKTLLPFVIGSRLILGIPSSRSLSAVLKMRDQSNHSINSSAPHPMSATAGRVAATAGRVAATAGRALLLVISDLAVQLISKKDISLLIMFTLALKNRSNRSDTCNATLVASGAIFADVFLSGVLFLILKCQGLNLIGNNNGSPHHPHPEILTEFSFRASQFDTWQDWLETSLKYLCLLVPLVAAQIASENLPSSDMESETKFLKLAFLILTGLPLLKRLSPSFASTGLPLLKRLSPSFASRFDQTPVQDHRNLLARAVKLNEEIAIESVLSSLSSWIQSALPSRIQSVLPSCIQDGRVKNAQLAELMARIHAREIPISQGGPGNVPPSKNRRWIEAARQEGGTNGGNPSGQGNSDITDIVLCGYARTCRALDRDYEVRLDELRHHELRYPRRVGNPADSAGFYPIP